MSNKNCFTGDTIVNTETGIKYIKDIQIGDKVLTYNFEKEETEYKDVTNVISHGMQILYKIIMDNEIILTTYNQLFYCNKTKVQAKFLRPGNQLQSIECTIPIENIKQVYKSCEVFDLEVQDNKNYYIGKNNILVLEH